MAPGRLYIKFFKDVQNSDIDIMLPGAEVGRDTSHSLDAQIGQHTGLGSAGQGQGRTQREVSTGRLLDRKASSKRCQPATLNIFPCG